MSDTRYSTALHILVLLSAERDEHHTSTSIAEQLGTNPVVVRRLMADLSRSGLVETRRGAGGGVSLKMDPSEISLGELADAIEADLTFDAHKLPDEIADPADVPMNGADLALGPQDDGKDHLPDAILRTIEAQRRELHTAAIIQMDRMTLKDLTQAATLRADLATLVARGLSDADIRSGYHIESGRLVPNEP